MKKIWNSYSYTIILVILSCLTALFISFSNQSVPTDEYIQVTVTKGDSLWKIAEEHAADNSMSKKKFISWMKKNNDLEEGTIYPGDELVIPVRIKDYEITGELASAAGEK